MTVPLPAPALLTVSGTSCRPKVAVTVVAAVRETVHEPVPEQPPPLQPVNVEPAAGLAERVTLPLGKLLEQVAPHEMPAGVLETVPAPLPALVTVSGTSCRSKVAVTVVAAVSETVQVPVPEQPPPLQPVKVEPAAGLAERVTLPLGKLLEQVAPHEMPAGVLETVPLPLPALLTVSGTSCRSKVAVTVVAAVRETVQCRCRSSRRHSSP